MKMRVDEARQDAPAVQIDHLAARPGQRQDIVVAADGQNAPGLHGQGGGVGRTRVLGPKLAVEEDKIGHICSPEVCKEGFQRKLANLETARLD